MNMKKFVAGVLACCIVCGTVPYYYGDNSNLINVNAEEYLGRPDNGFTYSEIANSKYKPALSVEKVNLSFEDAKIISQYGGIVSVNITVLGASQAYSSTGIHVNFYPSEYGSTITMGKNKIGKPDVVCGSAVEFLPALIKSNGDAGVFMTTSGNGDKGLDGTMYTLNFKLPENIRGGETFPIRIEYQSTEAAEDLFTNKVNNNTGKLMQAWVFTQGISNGYIHIEEPVTTTTTTTTTTSTTTTTTTTTTTPPNTADPITWGIDNWNFNNDDYCGYFDSSKYSQQMSESYKNALKNALTNSEYNVIFNGYRDSKNIWHEAWIEEKWEGSCYGMSATALLSKYGILPYSRYKSGAKSLYDLPYPSNNIDVSSLINYYQMLQVKNVIQQQYRTVPNRSHEENIKNILSLLDENSCVLVGFKDDDWGGHAILAYGYEYRNWSWDGVNYDGCIHILDPNHSVSYSDEYNIYFNSKTYNWTIPKYNEISSVKGSVFNYVGANVNEINEGGYLSGTSDSKITQYVSRIDAEAVASNHSVSKVKQSSNGSYLTQNTAAGEIIADVSFIAGDNKNGTFGYNLLDSESSYKITQKNPEPLQLTIDYDNCMLRAGSAAGTQVIFDKNGYVTVEGESADYNISMVFDYDYPTDWFAFNVNGQGADSVSMFKTSDGYILESDNLQNVSVSANNKENSAEVNFSTDYNKVLLYEIDENTIGVSVDTDGNGTYETKLNTDSFIKGDINKDGKVNISDAVSLQKWLLGTGNLTDWKNADLCKDNRIDVFDMVEMRKLIIQNK